MVPSFLLQPLVENALRHGVAKKPGRAQLSVTAALVGNELRVTVVDDGAGLAPGFDLDRDEGTGLRNIRVRLQQLFGQTARLTIEQRNGGGTIVRVAMPATATAQTRATA